MQVVKGYTRIKWLYYDKVLSSSALLVRLVSSTFIPLPIYLNIFRYYFCDRSEHPRSNGD